MKEPLLFHPGFYGGERGSGGGMCGVGRMDWEVGGGAPFISPGILWRGKGEGECVGLGGWIGKEGGGRGASIKLLRDGDTEKGRTS